LYFNPSTEIPLLAAPFRSQFVEKDGKRVKVNVPTSKKSSTVRRMELVNDCIPKLASICTVGENLDAWIRDPNGSRIVYEAVLEMNRYAFLDDYDSYESARTEEKDEEGPDGRQRSADLENDSSKHRARRSTPTNGKLARRSNKERDSSGAVSIPMEMEAAVGIDNVGDTQESSTRDELIRGELKKSVNEIFQLLGDKCKQLPLQSDENHLLQHRIAQYVIRRLILHLQPRTSFVATLAQSFSAVLPQIIECNRSAFILNALIANSDDNVRAKLLKLLASKQIRSQLAQCAVNVKGAAVLNKLVSST